MAFEARLSGDGTGGLAQYLDDDFTMQCMGRPSCFRDIPT